MLLGGGGGACIGSGGRPGGGGPGGGIGEGGGGGATSTGPMRLGGASANSWWGRSACERGFWAASNLWMDCCEFRV